MGVLPQLKLELFGAFCLKRQDGTSIDIGSRKNRLLIAILALSPNFSMTRERLAGLLWTDRSDGQARVVGQFEFFEFCIIDLVTSMASVTAINSLTSIWKDVFSP